MPVKGTPLCARPTEAGLARGEASPARGEAGLVGGVATTWASSFGLVTEEASTSGSASRLEEWGERVGEGMWSRRGRGAEGLARGLGSTGEFLGLNRGRVRRHDVITSVMRTVMTSNP